MNVPAFTALLLATLPLAAQDAPPKEAGPFRTPDLVEVAALDATIRLDVRYATSKNFLGKPFYSEARVFLQRDAAEAVVRVHRALKAKGYGLLLFDGYRPWSVTKAFWDATPEKKRVFVADPARGSRHNRGCAVDLTLYDLATGRAAEMGGEYDELSPRSHVTFEGAAKEELARRELLRHAMQDAGFFVYPWEWWHFDHRDWRDYPILDVPFATITPRAPDARPALDLSKARLVDLTHPFDERTLYWPNSPSSFELKRLAFGPTPGGFFYASNAICAPEHGGTHLDAPVHFGEGKESAEAVPLERLVAPAIVIDVAENAAGAPDYRLTPDDVTRWEARFGRVPRGAVVLLRTGWGTRYPDRKRYFGDDTPGETKNLHFPSYGREAAALLVEERDVAALGVDTASIDHGPSSDFPVHRIAAAANVPGFENLAGLEALPARGFWVAALPMKIAGGSGGPLRIVALLP